MGHPGKHIRIRRPYRLPLAAAPALFGLAAAFCLTAQAPAGAATAPASTPHAAVADITYHPGAAHVTLLSLDRRAAQPQAKSALPTWYTVRSGDSLAAISQRFYHNPGAWPVLYWANHHRIRSASEIKTGQVLNVPVKPVRIPNAPALFGQSAAPAPAKVLASATPMQAAPVQAAPAATYSGGGSFQSCVIARESGGSSQVMNDSGHYGLYQFSASTWAAYGGSPSSFGSASVAQQNQVFNNAMAAGGQSNWAPYDGC
jgi:LysM repeat protein